MKQVKGSIMNIIALLSILTVFSSALAFPSNQYGDIKSVLIDAKTTTQLYLVADKNDDRNDEYSRRSYLKNAMISTVAITSPVITAATIIPVPSANAAPTTTTTTTNAEGKINTFRKGKSRSEGYSVQKSASEWTSLLSGTQYNVLRRGGTERQRGSILEKEKRSGIFVCAGCNEPLFSSESKFDSGTGWPSFECAIDPNVIEIEEIGWMMDGAEVRCQTCGGHLGDVFGDGWRYGSKSGKRYCINGAALVFRPMDGGKEVRGDIPPPNKVIQYEPSLRRDT